MVISSPWKTQSSLFTVIKNCIVNQREVGSDSHTFGDALKHALRQDPDLLMGEMRPV